MKIASQGNKAGKSCPKTSSHISSAILELVHSNLVGPLPRKSLSKSNYFIAFTDDYSKKNWVYFLKTKNQAFEKFGEYRQMVKKESRNYIQTLRTDRRGDFLLKEFNSNYESNVIKQQLTQAKMPHQNGVAKQRNRTLVEKAQSMVASGGIPPFLQTKVINYANHLINRGPTNANQGINLE